MRKVTLALFMIAACSGTFVRSVARAQGQPPAQLKPDDLLARARALHKQFPAIDGHVDLPTALLWHNIGLDFNKADLHQPQPWMDRIDIPGLREGGFGGVFWSAWVPGNTRGPIAVTGTLQSLDVAYRALEKYADTFTQARTAADIERVMKTGKIAVVLGVEGGQSIDNSLAMLRTYYDLGVRRMTLTHSQNIDWGDSCCEPPTVGGLTKFGEEVVREMNRLGMLVDISHVSPGTMRAALRVSEAPVIFSHSIARAINDVPRNVPDDILKQIPKNGGIVMVNFVPPFVSAKVAAYDARRSAELQRLQAAHSNDSAAVAVGMTAWEQAHTRPHATLQEVADHVDHIRQMAGIDHIGIGGDWGVMRGGPDGLEDASKLPALTAELLRRGYSDADIAKILQLNFLRVMQQVEAVAARLRTERDPSLATIEQLDGPRAAGTGGSSSDRR
jgi:membrane dipeptidase